MYNFELELQALLREMGRLIMEWIFSEIEPAAAEAAPRRVVFERQQYRRRPKRNRPELATLFGFVRLERFLYEPLERGEPSIFPLEINLGIVAETARGDILIFCGAADSLQLSGSMDNPR